ncbi:leucyl-tRNA synthetase [Wallemia mellicola]|nr:leucyl-tRNA synthetase [Wallemia mellicola]
MTTQGPIQLEKTDKRDYLKDIEKSIQLQWKDNKTFEIDPPNELMELSTEELHKKYPKYLSTFPYPYMNGSLHLGHAFSISKVEFATGWERMKGKKALFPLGYHCTGMPIKAAADKLVREMELFGKDLSGYEQQSEEKPAETSTPAANQAEERKDKAQKGKIAAKNTGLQYQFQIMESIGVPRSEIHKFAEPEYWLEYFPPIAQADCTALGTRIDWRRSFITTDINPYYDAFVRWQMNKLKFLNKVKFGKRHTIYSIKDGQPCMDHDRSSGEGVGPQEYTGIKMQVLDWSDKISPEVKSTLANKKVFFVAATLRPETMYGQTNCYVGPKIEYGVFAVNDDEVFVCTERAIRNMAYQGVTAYEGEVRRLATIKGSDIVGTSLKAPLAILECIRILPMDSVLPTKGTGVVTSVPSDSPDDYANYMELRKKAEFYGIDPAWVSHDIIPVLKTPSFGDLTAKTLCEKFKVQSPKDAKNLAEAKELAYKEGFYSGVMVIGEYAGQPVQEVKNKVRDAMIKSNEAIAYSEPEGMVMSRSGDECIVALCDQWYLDYSEEAWKAQAFELLKRMNTYFPETRQGFEYSLGWLNQWACARSFGLGSKLPWDKQYLVESLTDSTIYMAYYTIAHLLQGDVKGTKPGQMGIKPEELTDEVFEYIFGGGPLPETSIKEEDLKRIQKEFSYFYPMDLRSSGKDLINNHLSFSIYNHSCLFPEDQWPRSMRANGHLMLNGQKMSKSTGNTLTLRDAVEKFGADATRLTLADAGDGIEDANFEEKTANAAILRLHTLTEWCKEVVENKGSFRTGPADTFHDKAFRNEMHHCIREAYKSYEGTFYKEALKLALYEFQSARDWYREVTIVEGMHADLILDWIKLQALIMTPLIPHFSEHVWQNILKLPGSVQHERYPEVPEVDQTLYDSLTYVRASVKTMRDAELALAKRKKGKANEAFDVKAKKALKVFTAKSYPAWQEQCVNFATECWTESDKTFDDGKLKNILIEKGLIKDKRIMPFIQSLKRRAMQFGGETAFNRTLPFNEREILLNCAAYFRKTLNLEQFEVVEVEGQNSSASDEYKDLPDHVKKLIDNAEPNSPGFQFYNVN